MRSLLNGLSLALALAAAAASWSRWADSNAMDFYQFWLVGQAAGEMRPERIWSPSGRAALGEIGARLALQPGATSAMRLAARKRLVLETYSTPLLYATFSALSTGDYELDYRVFHALSLGCTVAAVLGLCALFGFPAWAALVALATLLFLFEPFAADARVGNLNELQLAGVAAQLALFRGEPSRAKDLLAGALAALLALFKPNLLPALLALGALCAGRRDYRGLSWMACGAAAAGGAAALWSGARLGSLHSWPAWLAALQQLPPQAVALGNDSLARALAEAGAPGGPWLALALLAAVLAIAFRAGRAEAAVRLAAREGAGRGELGPSESAARAGSALDAGTSPPRPEPHPRVVSATAALGLGCAAAVLGAELAWAHYYLLLVPGLLLLLRPGAPRRGWAMLAALALAVPPQALGHLEPPLAVLLQLAAGAAIVLWLCARELLAPPPRSARS